MSQFDLTYGAKCIQTGEEFTFKTKEEFESFMIRTDTEQRIRDGQKEIVTLESKQQLIK